MGADIAPGLRDLDLSRAVVFLDFDGTLVDLAPTPDSVRIPDDLPMILDRLSRLTDGRLFIVSGRPVQQIVDYLPQFAGDIFGAHGAESRTQGRMNSHSLTGTDVVTTLHRAAQDLVDRHPNMLLERKQSGLVLHYRADPALEAEALRIAQTLLSAGPDNFELHHSKMAYEVRPNDADKGRVVDQVMARQRADFNPVVIGDDVTDEDAMIRAQALGGCGVKVGAGSSVADYYLADPAAVTTLLKYWTKDAGK